MSKIIEFFLSIINAITSLFEVVTVGVEYLLAIVNALPLIIVGPLVAGIAILVIFLILGRGS